MMVVNDDGDNDDGSDDDDDDVDEEEEEEDNNDDGDDEVMMTTMMMMRRRRTTMLMMMVVLVVMMVIELSLSDWRQNSNCFHGKSGGVVIIVSHRFSGKNTKFNKIIAVDKNTRFKQSSIHVKMLPSDKDIKYFIRHVTSMG